MAKSITLPKGIVMPQEKIMTKWNYIKVFDEESVSFSDVLDYHITSMFAGRFISQTELLNIKHQISHMIHTFYPFEPVCDVLNGIDVYENEGQVKIDMNSYSKYMLDKWSKEKMILESRRKKLKRLV